MIPQIVTSEIAAESDKYSFDCIIKALREVGPSFFYMWLRRVDEGKVAEPPGTMNLYDDMDMGFYPMMAAVNLGRLVDLFSWQRGLYPVDVVYTSRAAIAPLISLALADMSGLYPVPVVLTEPRVYGPGEVGHNQSNPTQLALRAAGYVTCFGMYWSKWERDAAFAAAAQYMTPAALKEMEKRAFVVDALVDVSQVRPTRQAQSKPRLLFAGRLNSNKKYKQVISAYAKVLMSRQDVEVWVHSGTGAFTKLDPADARWHRTSERLPRSLYWDLLGSAHVGAYLSHDEGANVTTQEMLASGIVLALPRRPWVEKLFHPLVYPYTVSGPAQLPALLDWLLDHYDEAHAVLTPFRELIVRERSWPAFKAKFQRLHEAVVQVRRPVPFRVFRTVVREVIGDGMPFSSAMRLFPGWQKGAPWFSEIRGMMACYRAVRDWDDYAAADPMLRRKEVSAVVNPGA